MLEIQMQLKGRDMLMLAEKIDRLERSRQQTIKEMDGKRYFSNPCIFSPVPLIESEE
jgi:hypothetical protein